MYQLNAAQIEANVKNPLRSLEGPGTYRAFKTALSFLFIVSTTAAYAGGSDRGGADFIIHMPGGEWGLADLVINPHTRKISKTPIPVIYDDLFGYLPSDEALRDVTKKAFEYIARKDPQEAKEVGDELAALSFVPKPKCEVPELHTGIRKFSQLAVQNFDTHEVYYADRDLTKACKDKNSFGSYQDLGFLSRTFFRIHEGYLRWAHDQGLSLEKAESVARDRVGEIANAPEFDDFLSQYFVQNILNRGVLYWAMLLGPIDAYDGYEALWNQVAERQFPDPDGFWMIALFKFPTGKRVLPFFLELLKELKLPCSQNPDAVEEILKSKGDGISHDQVKALCAPNEPEKRTGDTSHDEAVPASAPASNQSDVESAQDTGSNLGEKFGAIVVDAGRGPSIMVRFTLASEQPSECAGVTSMTKGLLSADRSKPIELSDYETDAPIGKEMLFTFRHAGVYYMDLLNEFPDRDCCYEIYAFDQNHNPMLVEPCALGNWMHYRFEVK